MASEFTARVASIASLILYALLRRYPVAGGEHLLVASGLDRIPTVFPDLPTIREPVWRSICELPRYAHQDCLVPRRNSLLQRGGNLSLSQMATARRDGME